MAYTGSQLSSFDVIQGAERAGAAAAFFTGETHGIANERTRSLPTPQLADEEMKGHGGATELRWSETEGRHLVAASSMSEGDEMLCEDSHMAILQKTHRKTVGLLSLGTVYVYFPCLGSF